jgi:hypothetical protein
MIGGRSSGHPQATERNFRARIGASGKRAVNRLEEGPRFAAASRPMILIGIREHVDVLDRGTAS